jgi:RNase P subunit RPR2
MKGIREKLLKIAEEIEEKYGSEGFLKYWYYIDRPVANGICEKCGTERELWSAVEIRSPETYSEWFETDEQVMEDPDSWHVFCANCISQIRTVQRDLGGQKFVEDWDSEEGVVILCLNCGWNHFISASWNSWGGREVVEEWVSREERQHDCDFYS